MSLGLVTALVAMSTLAVALLLAPLAWRRRAAATRDAYNLAVYRDQLAEIDRDVGRGILESGEAESARAEIGRRILALTPAATRRPGSTTTLAVAVSAVVLLPLAAWGLYWRLGSPFLPDQPFAARAQQKTAPVAGQPPLDMEEAERRLAAHLREHPDDLKGWLLLGRTQLALNRFPAAVDSYRHAVDLSGKRAEIVSDWAEAMVMAAGGKVTAEAKAAFETARADPDSAPRARYYLALARLQQGDAAGAMQDWVDLEADAPADAAWLPVVRERIAETAKTLGVDPAELKTSAGVARKPAPAEAKSADEQQAMIEGMVARLAARLEQNPDDAEGWARLGRSYLVLRRPLQARDAYARAAKLKPDDPALKAGYAEAIIAAAGDAAVPQEAVTLLRAVLAADPENAAALWYVGLAAAEAGQKAEARELWTRLLARLPKDAPERVELEQRLAALKAAPAR